MNASLIILAAGLGSRYGGSKQTDPIGPHGESLLDYAIHDSIQLGFSQLIFVISKEMSADFPRQIHARWDTALKQGGHTLQIDFVIQDSNDIPIRPKDSFGRKKPWGTAHAVWVCRSVVQHPFAIMNADDFYGRSSLKIMLEHLQTFDQSPQKAVSTSSPEACIVVYPISHTLSHHGSVSRGICRIEEGRLSHIEEHPKIKRSQGTILSTRNNHIQELSEDERVSMNLIGFNLSLFPVLEQLLMTFFSRVEPNDQSECYIPSLLQELIDQGRSVAALTTQEYWFGVTYREDRAEVQTRLRELHERNQYPSPVWAS